MYYPNIVTNETKSLIQQTSLALLENGHEIKPSGIKSFIGSTLPIPAIQKLIDELYNKDVNIRRNITTEGVHITFTYSRVNQVPTAVPKFGFISTLDDLSKYDQNLYVAYSSTTEPALFNTTDKYDARNQYKTLTGAKHNAVRMTKLSTFRIK